MEISDWIAGNIDKALDFDGKLDDVRIYNYALSRSEISNLYNCGKITRNKMYV